MLRVTRRSRYVLIGPGVHEATHPATLTSRAVGRRASLHFTEPLVHVVTLCRLSPRAPRWQRSTDRCHRDVFRGSAPGCAARVAFQKGLVRTAHAHPSREQVPLPSRRGRGLSPGRHRPPASGRARGGALGDDPPGQPAGAAPRATPSRRMSSWSRRREGWPASAASARMLWSPASSRRLARALDRFGPDLVHFHNIYHQLSPSILRPVHARGIPSVMTLHDYKLACPSYQLLSHGAICVRCVEGSTLNAVRERCKSGSLAASGVLALESGVHRRLHAYAKVDRFVSPSRFLRDVMLRAGIPPERIVTLANVVSVPQDEAWDRPRPAGRVGEARYLFAGRLSPEKGVDTLVRALAAAPDGVQLDIAGDGPSRARAGAARRRRGTGSGHVPRTGRQGRPRRADPGPRAMVVPSRWYENQPMTVLESFAAATPVVATSPGRAAGTRPRRHRGACRTAERPAGSGPRAVRARRRPGDRPAHGRTRPPALHHRVQRRSAPRRPRRCLR